MTPRWLDYKEVLAALELLVLKIGFLTYTVDSKKGKEDVFHPMGKEALECTDV